MPYRVLHVMSVRAMRAFGQPSANQLVDKHTSMPLAVFVRILDFLATLFRRFFCFGAVDEGVARRAARVRRRAVRALAGFQSIVAARA
jgi:hypothetical protein